MKYNSHFHLYKKQLMSIKIQYSLGCFHASATLKVFFELICVKSIDISNLFC